MLRDASNRQRARFESRDGDRARIEPRAVPKAVHLEEADATYHVVEVNPFTAIDQNGDGIDEYYLAEDALQCIDTGLSSIANSMGISWENMTTSVTGNLDINAIDLGIHHEAY